MLKSEIKVHKNCSNRFLDDILANDPSTKKTKKNSKKRFLGSITQSKLC
jgi:hypothetical protein